MQRPGADEGRLVALLEFQTAVEATFDVQVLAGLRFPAVLGFQKDMIHHKFIIPTGSPSIPRCRSR